MTLLELFTDIALSCFVAVGFALLFHTPAKAVIVSGLLGGVAHGLRFFLLQHEVGLVSSTMVATIFIGLSGIYFAHKIHTPPVVFTLPATITMIPGLYSYRTILGCIKIYEKGGEDCNDILLETVYNFILTTSLLFCLAIGISIVTLLFRKKSAREVRKIQDLKLH